MSVRTRLVVTLALIAVLLTLPAFFAAGGLSELRDLAVEGRFAHAEATRSAGSFETGLADLESALRSYVGTGAAPQRDTLFATLDSLASAADRFHALDSLASAADGVVGLNAAEAAPRLRTSVEALRAEVDSVDRLVQAGALEEATDRVLGPSYETRTAEVRERLAQLSDRVDERAQEDFERARSIGASTLRTTLFAIAVTVALALLLSAWSLRTLIRPLHQLRRALAGVTEGQLEPPADLPYDRRDEIGELAASFGSMSRRLAELDRLRAEFLGVASHELKTPINVIRGYAELVAEELAGEITERQREIMERIDEQTRLLARQVNRLMDISRLETGKYPVEPERIRLSDLLRGIERSFEQMARDRGIDLTLQIDPSSPEELVVDVDLIRHEVLGNLVSNALKFTPEGGSVSVRAWGEREGAVIEVSDTGPGIPPQHRGHIFEKYYQVAPSRAIGSGLGLAIAKEMVGAHGGTIELVGSGPGATFRVYLPVALSPLPHEVKLSL